MLIKTKKKSWMELFTFSVEYIVSISGHGVSRMPMLYQTRKLLGRL